MRGHVVLLGLACGLFMAANAAQETKKDQDLIQGTWQMDSAESDMGKLPPEQAKSLKRVFQGDQATLTRDGAVVTKGTFKLDPAKKPKAIDVTFSEGMQKGQTMSGIYELDGDTLKICFSPPGADRPTEFKPGPQRNVAVWKREKK